MEGQRAEFMLRYNVIPGMLQMVFSLADWITNDVRFRENIKF